MWGKKTVEPNSPQMTIWRIACWIPTATHTNTHTHRIWNIYCMSTATMVGRTQFNARL